VTLLEAGYDTPGLVELVSFVNKRPDPAGTARAAERALGELGAPAFADPQFVALSSALVAVCLRDGRGTIGGALELIGQLYARMDYPAEPPELRELFRLADFWGDGFSPYPQPEVERRVRGEFESLLRTSRLEAWRPDATVTRLLDAVTGGPVAAWDCTHRWCGPAGALPFELAAARGSLSRKSCVAPRQLPVRRGRADEHLTNIPVAPGCRERLAWVATRFDSPCIWRHFGAAQDFSSSSWSSSTSWGSLVRAQ
jgi:hypothetical protein